MGSYGSSGGRDIVHDWDPPPRYEDHPYQPPPPPRKTFAQARQEAKPVLPSGEKSPKRQIICTMMAGVLICLDTTGSMDENPKEVWNRAPLAAKEGARAVNIPSHEMGFAFATYGDAFTNDDLTVSDFNIPGEAVDAAMRGLNLETNGGGNRVESSDLVLAYLERYLVLGRTCKQLDVFLVTDEGIPTIIDPSYYEKYIGGQPKHERTTDVVAELRSRGIRIHCIMMTNTSTNAYHHIGICRSWEEALGGQAGIWKLSDPRRIADLMLLILGWESGRLDEAKREFEKRQRAHEEQRFAEENIPLVYNAFNEGMRHFPASVNTNHSVEPLPLDDD